MNVMFIVSSLYGGGAERVVARLASALCTTHKVHIVTAMPLDNAKTYEHDPRIELHDLMPATLIGKLCARTRGLRTLRRWQALRVLKWRLHIDVAASFLTYCNHDNVMSRTGERTIVSIRSILANTIPHNPRQAQTELLRIRTAARHADKIVTVSRNCAFEQVEDYGADPTRITTIYNPIDAPDLARRALKSPANEDFQLFRQQHGVVVLTAGRLVEQKGQWHLIRALRAVRTTHPEAGLVILGTGDLRQQLQQVADANGLHDHVLFAGFDPEPFGYMGASDLFVMPSLFEGFSNALLEAMACGLPLVAADCNSGPRELLAPATNPRVAATAVEQAPYGILTPPLSGEVNLIDEPLQPAERALADAMTLLLEDSALREHYRAQGAQRICDFSVDRIVAQWCEALEITAPPQKGEGA